MIDEGSKATTRFEVILSEILLHLQAGARRGLFKSIPCRKGFRLVSITLRADDSPTGKLMKAISKSVDEFNSESLSQEVVWGRGRPQPHGQG